MHTVCSGPGHTPGEFGRQLLRVGRRQCHVDPVGDAHPQRLRSQAFDPFVLRIANSRGAVRKAPRARGETWTRSFSAYTVCRNKYLTQRSQRYAESAEKTVEVRPT